MNLNLVGRIIAGFALFGCIIIATNIISYFGLAEIRESANSVVSQKMPVQAQMLKIQTGILTLAKVSTNGFYEDTLTDIGINRQAFDVLAENFIQDLTQMNSLISATNKAYKEGESSSRNYIDKSQAMYRARTEQLELDQAIKQKASEILVSLDEASALMLDLSFIESDDPNIETLIGAGLNLDNKITTMIKSVKEFTNVTAKDLSETIKGDIEFTLSNIQVDSDYLNRLAETIDTDGYVQGFNQEFQKLTSLINEPDGLFDLQSRKIALISLSGLEYAEAEQQLDTAISAFSTVFANVNDDTLQGQNAIIDAVNSNIWKGIVILLFAIVVAIILGTLTAKSIAKPIGRINRSLAIISSGDLTHQAYSTNNDEFAVLAENVNKLTDSLHSVVSQINLTETALEDATKTSTHLGNQTLQQVERQKEQLSVTASDTHSIRVASKSNTEQIQDGMTQLQRVSEQSIAVGQLVAKTHKQISEQAQQANQSSLIIHRLEENTKKIGSILDVIKTIAEQTNLLALNAAIEAARAGEQGRGFAVVADEVRTLATRTHNSTEEIESMIVTLQADASQAVEAIKTGNEHALHSEQQIQDVNSQVSDIGATINQLRDMNKHIVSVTLEQDSLFEKVANNLTNIVELAEQSADTTKRSSDATKQLDSLMIELKHAVSRFKL